MKNKFLLFISFLVYGIMLQQSELRHVKTEQQVGTLDWRDKGRQVVVPGSPAGPKCLSFNPQALSQNTAFKLFQPLESQ